MLEQHLNAENPVSLVFAIPDHPWVDSADGAAVRIAMTCAAGDKHMGSLQHVVVEREGEGVGYDVELTYIQGEILADLTIGARVSEAVPLRANADISSRGFELGGSGFIVSREEATDLGLGTIPGIENHIREYRNGRDLTSRPREVLCIELGGITEVQLRNDYPAIYQWLITRVKPQRQQNRDKRLRERWWLHRRSRDDLRKMLLGLPRYIATVETSKHRFFQFLDASILPDNKLICVALDDAYFLGVLSSRVHLKWIAVAGSLLEDRPVYVKTTCFETFPFPDSNPEQRTRICELAEQLDAHRKSRQANHPKLTMTGMYNVLEKLRSGEVLTTAEKTIHKQGLVSVLKQLHDDLDEAVSEAYGWPVDLAEDELLNRLVALNAERAAEESRGNIRWLRPEFQNPDKSNSQAELDIKASATSATKPKTGVKKLPWPKALPDQVSAVRATLTEVGQPVKAEVIARHFMRARTDKVIPILETLVAVGHARQTTGGLFVAAT